MQNVYTLVGYNSKHLDFACHYGIHGMLKADTDQAMCFNVFIFIYKKRS